MTRKVACGCELYSPVSPDHWPTEIEFCPLHAAAEETTKQRDRLLVLVQAYLMTNGHFYDCIPGRRGKAPNDEHCSTVCIDLRAAIAAAQPAAEVQP